jgi:hypothetical protein
LLFFGLKLKRTETAAPPFSFSSGFDRNSYFAI